MKPSSSTPNRPAGYYLLNAVEQRIVDGWVSGGMTYSAAIKQLEQDLADAAEEDGYDGP